MANYAIKKWEITMDDFTCENGFDQLGLAKIWNLYADKGYRLLQTHIVPVRSSGRSHGQIGGSKIHNLMNRFARGGISAKLDPMNTAVQSENMNTVFYLIAIFVCDDQ